MTPAELFTACGRALFGADFTSALAAELEVDRTTVQKWSVGKSRVPPGVWAELHGLAKKRAGELEGISELIARLADRL